MLFNNSAELIIAHVGILRDRCTLDSLYVRHPADKSYVCLADDSSDDISLSSPFSSPNGPVLYVLEMKAHRYKDEYQGYDILGIREYDLRSMELARRLPSTNLKSHENYKRIWPSSIVGEKREGVLCCSIGMQGKEGKVGYFLCEITLADGTIDKLTSLDHVFL